MVVGQSFQSDRKLHVASPHYVLDLECAELVKAATKEAEKNGILGHGMHHPFHTMFEDVFEELPWHLEVQAAQATRERKMKWPETGRPG